jgi:hypothetical protein
MTGPYLRVGKQLQGLSVGAERGRTPRQDADSGKFLKVKTDPDCQFDPERTRPRYTGQDIATMITA